MTAHVCASPLALATLVEYWLGELDEAQEEHVERHLLGCGRCSGELERLAALADGLRDAVRSGAVHAVLSAAFLQRLTAQGLRLREYRVAHNGSVHCTVAPDDDLLVAHLAAPLAGVEQLDIERVGGDGGSERLRDVPFDAAAGEVVLAPRTGSIRSLPASTVRYRLLAVAADGERTIGEYTFHHTPWPAAHRG